jgi:hypothetical protein
MSEDPIVAETRAARERLVSRFDGDLDRLCEHLRALESEVSDRVVHRAPKKPATTEVRRVS